MTIKRRDFLAGAGGIVAAARVARAQTNPVVTADARPAAPSRAFNTSYAGDHLEQVAFPMGGIGAGTICLEGAGALSHVSIRNRPEIFNEPCIFAAVAIKSQATVARILEGPVPKRKIFAAGSGLGFPGATYGLPRFAEAAFAARFPFGTVTLKAIPICRLTSRSPAGVRSSPARMTIPACPSAPWNIASPIARWPRSIWSSLFNAKNFLADDTTPANLKAVRAAEGGFIFWNGAPAEKPWQENFFSAEAGEPETKVNHAWFRGDWWDAVTLAWKDVATGAAYDAPPPASGLPSPGASLFVPFTLAPGASRTIPLRLSWYSGKSDLRSADDPFVWPWPEGKAGVGEADTYRPWYAGRFDGIQSVRAYWRDQYQRLRDGALRFGDCFHDSTLPPEVVEAVSANLGILKSPTILRQTDGRIWGWEGCDDNSGSPGGTGSCTHVWNYAQSMPHLFPALERTLRETEFGPSQDETGHQAFRHALPIRSCLHKFYAAADGQLGGIMKVHREWRISGDNDWLKRIWPRVKQSLDYCIATWDPGHGGLVEDPHHNTYDIEFWGPDGMCSSFYLGALQAAIQMGHALGDPRPLYETLFAKGKKRMESELFNGEYFHQRVQLKGARGPYPLKTGFFNEYSPDSVALFAKEGPKYQYGDGCLSDGVLGQWMAFVCGVGEPVSPAKITAHLKAVHHYNLKASLARYANPQRPGYALGEEGGLLLCTWPKGGALSLPFVYSNEVWTGIEYQCASHMIRSGLVQEGLEIVRACRSRYDGRVRNPFDEYEYGHWYARAMASYALLEALSGARFDAVEKILYLQPRVKGDFRSFLSTASGYGTVGVKNGRPFVKMVAGTIPYARIDYTLA